jgi:hypothetical protein
VRGRSAKGRDICTGVTVIEPRRLDSLQPCLPASMCSMAMATQPVLSGFARRVC